MSRRNASATYPHPGPLIKILSNRAALTEVLSGVLAPSDAVKASKAIKALVHDRTKQQQICGKIKHAEKSEEIATTEWITELRATIRRSNSSLNALSIIKQGQVYFDNCRHRKLTPLEAWQGYRGKP